MRRKILLVLAVILALALPSGVVGLVQYRTQSKTDEVRALAAELCDFQQRAWTTQRLQIADDAKPVKPSEQVLRVFPQIRPFYDPKNPLYAEQIRSLNERADRKRRILGPRPSC